MIHRHEFRWLMLDWPSHFVINQHSTTGNIHYIENHTFPASAISKQNYRKRHKEYKYYLVINFNRVVSKSQGLYVRIIHQARKVPIFYIPITPQTLQVPNLFFRLFHLPHFPHVRTCDLSFLFVHLAAILLLVLSFLPYRIINCVPESFIYLEAAC